MSDSSFHNIGNALMNNETVVDILYNVLLIIGIGKGYRHFLNALTTSKV
jgi:hypothetical protein